MEYWGGFETLILVEAVVWSGQPSPGELRTLGEQRMGQNDDN